MSKDFTSQVYDSFPDIDMTLLPDRCTIEFLPDIDITLLPDRCLIEFLPDIDITLLPDRCMIDFYLTLLLDIAT